MTTLGPKCDLPLPDGYANEESYVRDLLEFATSSHLFRKLTEESHILDFFTSEPDMYRHVFDEDWRNWFSLHDIDILLEFFLRENLEPFLQSKSTTTTWHDQPSPPISLVKYVYKIRSLSLSRNFVSTSRTSGLTKRISIGMKPKKVHEVSNFARYIHKLTLELEQTKKLTISHLIDFGAGQGYLGRFLASEPHNRNVIAVESRPHNVKSAKSYDVYAQIAPKIDVLRNKKQYKAEIAAQNPAMSSGSFAPRKTKVENEESLTGRIDVSPSSPQSESALNSAIEGKGVIRHIEQSLESGDLENIIRDVTKNNASDSTKLKYSTENENCKPKYQDITNGINNTRQQPRLLVMSLHSCGNLTHYALRSLILNPSVAAVAAVGCCYNLVTERLRPPSFKSEELRLALQSTQKHNQCGDPQGFPMSYRLCNYPLPHGKGMSINISARMMAVQAPTNWTHIEADSFFTRHFFRSLLQRVLLDRGIVEPPIQKADEHKYAQAVAPRSPAGGGGSTQPIVVGSLPKRSYCDFPTYVRDAIRKLKGADHPHSHLFGTLDAMTQEELGGYAATFQRRRKEVAVLWTLMALSATLIEAVFIVDRWLWLREQENIERCWVEPVFDYSQSPRNLVVVGIKKTNVSNFDMDT